MRLLIVGDLGGQLVAASRIATKSGAKVLHVANIESAMQALRSGKQAEMIFIDIYQDIKKLITSLSSERITVPVIACGVKNDAERAVKAIEEGAKEYLPLPPQEELIAAIFETIAKSDDDQHVIGNSTSISEALKVATQVAQSEASVLLTGESGTGKEVFAKYIHAHSKRAKEDLISINCAAIPENLLESELFGHEKGAFTGAVERRIGKFEAANNSTIFLDEISEMDIKLQAKLLRVLQEKEVTRVGGNKPVQTNVRIVASSNRDLLEYVREGKFREDLFYRLNVINIHLPPLRDRKDDIPLFATAFITKYAQLNCVDEKSISKNAMKKLSEYSWPGNVRELENCMHRALLLSPSNEIQDTDIALISEKIPSNSNNRTLEQIERDAVQSAISDSKGDEARAALVLGISIRSLRNKLKQYKLAAGV